MNATIFGICEINERLRPWDRTCTGKAFAAVGQACFFPSEQSKFFGYGEI